MTFLEAAYKVLRVKKKPLHAKEITKIALQEGWLKTRGKTPWATMTAQLLREIEAKRGKARFIKAGPSTFAVNSQYKEKRGLMRNKSKSKKLLSEEFVKRAIIKWLSRNGWGYFEYDDLHTHGVDIKARKGGRLIFVETKGESKNRSGNEVSFVYSLGQIITRMKVINARYAYSYVLGLPTSVAKIALRRLPWQFAKKVCLYIFSVDGKGRIRKYSWQDLRKMQG